MSDRGRSNDPGEEQRLKEALLGAELAQLRDLVQRFGDDAALAESVRRVIVDVLRKAGVQDHDRVAEALAPLVVETVAQEIPRQKHRIADALLPQARRLVAAGFGGAIAGLARGIDTVASPLVWARRGNAVLTRQPVGSAQVGGGLWLEGAVLFHDPSGTAVFSDFSAARTRQFDAEADNPVLTASEPTLIHASSTPAWRVHGDGLTWIVAVQGRHGQAIGNEIGWIFQEFTDRWRETVAALGNQPPGPILSANLARDLEARCRTAFGMAPGDPKPKAKPWFGYAVLALTLAVLIAWAGLHYWEARREAAILASAQAVIDQDPRLARLPLNLRYDAEADRIVVRGIVGDRNLTEWVESALAAGLPDRAIDVLLIAPPPVPDTAPVPVPGGQLEDRIQALVARVNALQNQFAPNIIQSWFSQRIVHFTSDTEYTDPGLAAEQFKAIAQVFKDWPPEFNLRVVGYSDATGSERGQDKASLDRALAVIGALIAAGVPRERLAAVGRAAAKPLSFIQGAGSINRRVEFEVYTPLP